MAFPRHRNPRFLAPLRTLRRGQPVQPRLELVAVSTSGPTSVVCTLIIGSSLCASATPAWCGASFFGAMPRPARLFVSPRLRGPAYGLIGFASSSALASISLGDVLVLRLDGEAAWPVTSAVIQDSSAVSRTAASDALSPGSTCPPGSSQSPVSQRRTSSILPVMLRTAGTSRQRNEGAGRSASGGTFVMVATYPDEATAREDYQVVKDADAPGLVGSYEAARPRPAVWSAASCGHPRCQRWIDAPPLTVISLGSRWSARRMAGPVGTRRATARRGRDRSPVPSNANLPAAWSTVIACAGCVAAKATWAESEYRQP